MVPNLTYTEWLVKDQQVLCYLVASLHCNVLAQVASSITARDLWQATEAMFAFQTRVRAINTRITLATTKKGVLSVTAYVAKMRALGDEMAAAGKPLDDKELVSFIMTGLDNLEFNPVVSVVLARVEPISINELFTQLLVFEQHTDLIHGTSMAPQADQPTLPLMVVETVLLVTTVAAVQTLAAAMVVAVVAASTTMARRRPSANSARGEAMKWCTAGTALKRTSLSLKRRVQTLPATTMVWTQIGILILVPRTTSQDNWTRWCIVTDTTVVTRSMRPMEQV